jgi:hypothetical protein
LEDTFSFEALPMKQKARVSSSLEFSLKVFYAGLVAHAMPAIPESESSSESSVSLGSDDSSSSESISFPMYALALQEVYFRFEEDVDGFLEDFKEDLEEELSFFLKNFLISSRHRSHSACSSFFLLTEEYHSVH